MNSNSALVFSNDTLAPIPFQRSLETALFQLARLKSDLFINRSKKATRFVSPPDSIHHRSARPKRNTNTKGDEYPTVLTSPTAHDENGPQDPMERSKVTHGSFQSCVVTLQTCPRPTNSVLEHLVSLAHHLHQDDPIGPLSCSIGLVCEHPVPSGPSLPLRTSWRRGWR